MTVAPQASNETELVTGTITGVVTKPGDKWQVVVQPDGAQYTKNLWTKDEMLAGQMAQMVGSRQAFLCGISHWVNQQGQQVRSLWINGVGPQAIQQQQQAGYDPTPTQRVAQPQQWQQPQPPTVVQPTVTQMGPAQAPPIEQTSRYLQERAVERPFIHRQTASKVAAILISHVPAEQRTIDNVIGLAERLVAYYEHGYGQPFAERAATQQSQPQQGGTDGYQHTDDDIPF